MGRSGIIGLCLLAGLGLGAGALVSVISRSAAPTPPRIERFAPIDEPATTLAAVAPPPQAADPVAPQLVAEPPASVLTPRPAPTLARATLPRPRPRPEAIKPERAKIVAPQDAWRQQREDYDRARQAYDASERAEGYRWAQQNRIRVVRYCRAAETRTSAFVDGCMNYLRSVQIKGAGRAEDSSRISWVAPASASSGSSGGRSQQPAAASRPDAARSGSDDPIL